MSSVFSRKITMFTSCGAFTGDGTPSNQRTGRTQAYRSSCWRNATLSERKPPPTGVVSGPLMATRYFEIAETVSSGSHVLSTFFDFSPASTSYHAIRRVVPYALRTAPSSTSCDARQMSGPVPSPSMNGTMGSVGTDNLPSRIVIGWPAGGARFLYSDTVEVDICSLGSRRGTLELLQSYVG